MRRTATATCSMTASAATSSTRSDLPGDDHSGGDTSRSPPAFGARLPMPGGGPRRWVTECLRAAYPPGRHDVSARDKAVMNALIRSPALHANRPAHHTG